MKFLFRLVTILLVLVVMAAGLLWFALPTDRIGQIASDRLEAATGRTLTLSGDFRPSLWPDIGVTTGPLAISNASWAQEPVFVSAQGASVAVDLMALLSGEVRIRDLTLDEPVIALERAADGRTNWTFGAPVDGTQEPQGASAPAIAELAASVRGGRVRYVDRASGRTHDVQAINANMELAETGRAVALDLDAVADGIALDLKGTARFADALGVGPVTLDLLLESDVAQLSYVGDVSDAQTFDGVISLVLPDPNAALTRAGMAPIPGAAGRIRDLAIDAVVVSEVGNALVEGTGSVIRDDTRLNLALNASGPVPDGPLSTDLRLVIGEIGEVTFSGLVDLTGPGLSGPLRLTASHAPDLADFAARGGVDLPPGLAGPMQIAGFLDASPTRFSLGDARLAVGEIDAAGRIAVSLANRPRLTGQLSLLALDLDRFVSDGEPDREAPRSGAGWPQDPLPYEALSLLDADLDLDVESLRSGGLELGRTRLSALLEAGNLTLDIREANGFGGVLTGALGVNGPGQRVDIDLSLAGVRLERVLGFLADTERLEGQAALAARLTAEGSSIATLMQSLTGQITADMADGALRGVNLAALARNFTDPGGNTQRTDFTEAAIALDIRDGVAEVATLSALGPLIRLAGEGVVGLGAQTLNLTLRPRIVGDLQGQGGSFDARGITLPVLVSGPWHDLSFRPDLSALEDLAREEVKDEVDAAIDAAVDDARDDLAERLGVTPEAESGVSVDDQLRDELENRLREGLGGIFR